jgi:molecular chaperone DnaK (HSP70)
MNPTGSDAVSFTIQGETFSATHLAALIFSLAKKQAEAYGKDPVSGAVCYLLIFID